MEAKYPVGTVVRLKSGGPKMTINRIILKRNVTAGMRGISDDFEGNYECKWFEDVKPFTGEFHEDTLTPEE